MVQWVNRRKRLGRDGRGFLIVTKFKLKDIESGKVPDPICGRRPDHGGELIMAVPRKLVVVQNSATRELWRIAEIGEMDELMAVLPQADINARNEHGMTALMRCIARPRAGGSACCSNMGPIRT